MSTPEVTVAAAIIRRDGRLLLTRRAEGTHLAGQWEFPGGKVETGETPASALVREIREELGVDVAVERLYMECRHQYPERSVRLHFFECAIRAGKPECQAATALAWVLPEELGDLDLPEANRELVERLLRRQ